MEIQISFQAEAATGTSWVGGSSADDVWTTNGFVSVLSVADGRGCGDGAGGVSIWAGGLCFSFVNTCLMRERSVAFPGLGPWLTTTEGFFLSLERDLPSMEGNSWGTSSATAFQ